MVELSGPPQMRRGTLSEQYVERPTTNGGTVKFGPYFKFQIWQDGRNQTRSVTTDEALLLREDIDNFHRFEQLCQQLAQLNIQHTIALRATEPAAANTEKKTPNSIPRRKIPRNRTLPPPSAPKTHPKTRTRKSNPMARNRPARRLCP
jgi:hypothetical protein